MNSLDDFENYEPNGKYNVLFVNSSCLCQEFSDNPLCCEVPTIKVADGAVNPLNPDYTAKVCEGIVEVLRQNCYPPEVVESQEAEAAVDEDVEEPAAAARSIDVEDPSTTCDEFKRWYILIPIIFSLILVIVVLMLWYNLHQERKKNKRLEEELARTKTKNGDASSIYPIKDSAVQRMEDDCEAAIAAAGASSSSRYDKDSSYSARSHMDKTEYEEASESNSECWEVEDVEIREVAPRKEAKSLLKVKL
jgi:hypothetical protein